MSKYFKQLVKHQLTPNNKYIPLVQGIIYLFGKYLFSASNAGVLHQAPRIKP